MTLCLGMSGAYVKRVQELLAELLLYRGPIDSSYGGGTLAAVKTYQGEHGLPRSGMVDAATWARMFPGKPEPVSSLAMQPLCDRCLALTGSFETSSYPPESFCGLSGDFDGMGISFGVCQWNLGQGTLQPMLEKMFDQYANVARNIFHDFLEVLAVLKDDAVPDQLAFARSIQYKGRVNEPWRGMFLALGRTPEFQQIQRDAAAARFQTALELCERFGLTSERAAALMFDVVVQNGSIRAGVGQAIRVAINRLRAGADGETAKMVIVANEVASASDPQYADDVRLRKLAIAQGTGTVHGHYYDVEQMFGIRLSPFTAG